ncbi:MAG: TRAP transporter substrate-binding protein DctP [Rhodospirillales bacterium]|nr:TRAP transporter substrate-binding protein DctP [Rhodospirillales bacterium]
MLRISNKLLAGIAVGAFCLSTSAVFAKDKIELIHSDTVADNNIRSITLRKEFGECLGDEFSFKDYHGATLFKQGTELTAMQRGNLDTGTLAVFDFYNQVPEMSILGTGYLYRSYEHMRAVWDSGVLDDLKKLVEEKAKIKILSNPYIGKRHVNIKGDKKIMTPADLAGIKLRMPGGEGWQFLGEALGANPTPLAFTEVYTALQTGAVDGQDNALPADKSMKFYEVTDQIILTGHFIANNQFSISMAKWNSLNADQQAKVQSCATNFQEKLDVIMLKEEAELIDFFVAEGLKVYEPDIDAFRNHVLGVYQNSKFSKDWPEGLVEKINAL